MVRFCFKLSHLLQTKQKSPFFYPSPLWLNTSSPLRALRPPGWLPHWHCGVRVSSNKKLVGFISAIPANIRIYDTWANRWWSNTVHFVTILKIREPDTLLNSSSMSHQAEEDGRDQLPVCPQKAAFKTRRSCADQRNHTAGELRGNISGGVHSWSGAAQTCVHMQVRCAEYMHDCKIQSPLKTDTSVALSRYWHRSLNPRKLVEVKFSHLSRNMTLQRTMKLYRLPDVNIVNTTQCPLQVYQVTAGFIYIYILKKIRMSLFFPGTEHQNFWSETHGETWHQTGHGAATEISKTFPSGALYGGRGGGTLVPAAGQHYRHICCRGMFCCVLN